jgi:hypothetical protein
MSDGDPAFRFVCPWILFEGHDGSGYVPVARKKIWLDPLRDGVERFEVHETDAEGRLRRRGEGGRLIPAPLDVEGLYQVVVLPGSARDDQVTEEALRDATKSGRSLASAEVRLAALEGRHVQRLGFDVEAFLGTAPVQGALSRKRAAETEVASVERRLSHLAQEVHDLTVETRSLREDLASDRYQERTIKLTRGRTLSTMAWALELEGDQYVVEVPSGRIRLSRREVQSITCPHQREHDAKKKLLDERSDRLARVREEHRLLEPELSEARARRSAAQTHLRELLDRPAHAIVLPRRHPMAFLWPRTKEGEEDNPVRARFVYVRCPGGAWEELVTDTKGRALSVDALRTGHVSAATGFPATVDAFGPLSEPPWVAFGGEEIDVVVCHRRLDPEERARWLQRRARLESGYDQSTGFLVYRLLPSDDLPANAPPLVGDLATRAEELTAFYPAIVDAPNDPARRAALGEALVAATSPKHEAGSGMTCSFRELVVHLLVWAPENRSGDVRARPRHRLRSAWIRKGQVCRPFSESFEELRAALREEGERGTLDALSADAALYETDFVCVAEVVMLGASCTLKVEGIDSSGNYHSPRSFPFPYKDPEPPPHRDLNYLQQWRAYLLLPPSGQDIWGQAWTGVWQMAAEHEQHPGVRALGRRFWVVQVPAGQTAAIQTIEVEFDAEKAAAARRWAPALFFGKGEKFFPRTAFAHIHGAVKNSMAAFIQECLDHDGTMAPGGSEDVLALVDTPGADPEGFAPTVYANVGTWDGRSFTQFFFCLLDSVSTSEEGSPLEASHHQGDWELVYFEEGESGQSCFACHTSVMGRSTKDLLLLGDEWSLQPAVFMAARGHGCYPAPGVAFWAPKTLYRDLGASGTLHLGAHDFALGDEARWDLVGTGEAEGGSGYVIDMIDDQTPWLAFRGRWGANMATVLGGVPSVPAPSARGPLYRDLMKWTSGSPSACPRVWADWAGTHQAWRELAATLADASFFVRRSAKGQLEVYYYLHKKVEEVYLHGWDANWSLFAGSSEDTLSRITADASAFYPGWHQIDIPPSDRYLRNIGGRDIVSMSFYAAMAATHDVTAHLYYGYREAPALAAIIDELADAARKAGLRIHSRRWSSK